MRSRAWLAGTALLALIPLSVKAQESAWYRVGIDTRLNFRYADVGSIYEFGGYRRAWAALIFGEGTPRSERGEAADLLGLLEVDCPQRRMRWQTITSYGFQSRKLEELSGPLDWEFIRPDSPDSRYVEAICLPQSAWGEREFRLVRDGNYRSDHAEFMFSSIELSPEDQRAIDDAARPKAEGADAQSPPE